MITLTYHSIPNGMIGSDPPFDTAFMNGVLSERGPRATGCDAAASALPVHTLLRQGVGACHVVARPLRRRCGRRSAANRRLWTRACASILARVIDGDDGVGLTVRSCMCVV